MTDQEVRTAIESLEDEAASYQQRLQAVWTLQKMGPAAVVVPALIQTLLEDKDPGVRGHAAFVLGHIGPEEGVVPALIQTMVDDPNMRWAVTEGLKNIGPAAAEAVPALIQALEDECASEIKKVCDIERNAIVRALRAITGQDFAEDASAWREWWEEQQ
jgi:HEAT repeat protein